MKNNEWYTPAIYIEAAREVMGSIDLDPASSELANRIVKAEKYYTKEENGLMYPWYGNVWLNPPYGRTNKYTSSLQQRFIEKLVREDIEQAILLLLGNACFRKYFEPLWEYLLCFNQGDIAFFREDGENGHFGFGTLFVYIGNNEEKFIEVFSQFGPIVKHVSEIKEQTRELELWSTLQTP